MSILAFINPSAYSKPGSAKVALTRLRQNVAIYKRNYISTGVLLFFLTILTSPSILFPLLLVGAFWVFLLSTHEDPDAEPTQIGPIAINKRNKCLAALPFTLIFVWWMASAALSWCLILTALLTGVHGVFHTAPAHMKALAGVSTMTGEIPTHDTGDVQTNPVDGDDWWEMQ